MSSVAGLHTTFSEVMIGQVVSRAPTVHAETPRQCSMELDVDIPELLHPLADVRATLCGRVHIAGIVDDPHATGTLHVAPFTRKRIRYTLNLVDFDGRELVLDGWKSVSYTRLLRSMTTLPATVTDSSGEVVAELAVHFDIKRHLPGMLRSFRLRRDTRTPAAHTELAPRWNGEPTRLEAWYTTVTDSETGTGLWLHHELVVPSGNESTRAHGWAAVFPPDAEPDMQRFGPQEWHRPGTELYFDTSDVTASIDHLAGRAGDIDWDLSVSRAQEPLFTFPRWAWRSGLLPGAQIVPQPGATYSGTLRWGDRSVRLRQAPGATSHLYGHGNAQRWAWLHAELGDGDVAEVVAAVSTKPGLRHLAPLPFVRLRIGGEQWPAVDPLLAALCLRAEVDLPTWRVYGRLGRHRLRIEVSQPPDSTVAVEYTDPDGSRALCRNSERAEAFILLEQRRNGHWHERVSQHLTATAHAEVGTRG